MVAGVESAATQSAKRVLGESGLEQEPGQAGRATLQAPAAAPRRAIQRDRCPEPHRPDRSSGTIRVGATRAAKIRSRARWLLRLASPCRRYRSRWQPRSRWGSRPRTRTPRSAVPRTSNVPWRSPQRAALPKRLGRRVGQTQLTRRTANGPKSQYTTPADRRAARASEVAAGA